MKKPLNIAITFFLLALIVKLLIYTLHLQHTFIDENIAFLYLLLLLLCAFFGIRNNKLRKLPKATIVREDIKVGMRTTAYFSILLALFVYVYYAYIDPHYFESEIHHRLVTAYDAFADQGMSRDEIKEKLVKYVLDMKVIYKPSIRAWATLILLTFMSFFDSLLIALGYKMMSKRKIV